MTLDEARQILWDRDPIFQDAYSQAMSYLKTPTSEFREQLAYSERDYHGYLDYFGRHEIEEAMRSLVRSGEQDQVLHALQVRLRDAIDLLGCMHAEDGQVLPFAGKLVLCRAIEFIQATRGVPLLGLSPITAKDNLKIAEVALDLGFFNTYSSIRITNLKNILLGILKSHSTIIQRLVLPGMGDDKVAHFVWQIRRHTLGESFKANDLALGQSSPATRTRFLTAAVKAGWLSATGNGASARYLIARKFPCFDLRPSP